MFRSARGGKAQCVCVCVKEGKKMHAPPAATDPDLVRLAQHNLCLA